MPDLATERGCLDAALARIRLYVVGATTALLTTSDQQVGYGFVLEDVRLGDGSRASRRYPGKIARLANDVHPNLADLSWDGVVGEDAHGNAEVPLT